MDVALLDLGAVYDVVDLVVEVGLLLVVLLVDEQLHLLGPTTLLLLQHLVLLPDQLLDVVGLQGLFGAHRVEATRNDQVLDTALALNTYDAK